MATQPTVIAEMVFAERHIADNVIATFNNQKADGRILHVFLKRHGPGSAPSAPSRKSEPLLVSEATPTPPNKELFADNSETTEMVDIEMTTEATSAYEDSREAANQDRRERESRRAEPDIQDGSYGFGGNNKDERSTTDAPQAEIPTQPREDRKGSSSRREGDRERDRERDRRYDDSRYDRRDERGSGSASGSYHRHERPDNYDNRGGRPSHYGNGVGGRGEYPDSGRMYSDDVMRGGRGGGRGMRGDYRGYR